MSQNMIDLLLNQLKNELPPNLQNKISEFKTLVDAENYRAAYAVLDGLKRIKGWSPSQKLLGYYEKFWWEYAN